MGSHHSQFWAFLSTRRPFRVLIIFLSLIFGVARPEAAIGDEFKIYGTGECFPDDGIDIGAGSSTCYYLYPYNLHLTNGDTATLQVVDSNGTPLSGPFSFTGYDMTLISISSAGLVTALRTETSTEIGTWVSVGGLLGLDVANTCVVRVLGLPHDNTFVTAESENTILYYPDSINGEDITVYVSLYEMATVDEYFYELEGELMGLQPFGGCKHILEVDFGESETQRVCGISGNPLRLGWNIFGTAWQNCFLVPFTPPRSPQWFIISHELGHNFTWPSQTFGEALGPVVTYSEGLASAIGIECCARMLEDPGSYPLGSAASTTIQSQVSLYRSSWNTQYQQWLAGGALFNEFGADEADAIWFIYDSLYAGDFGSRFFKPLQPQYYGTLSPVIQSAQANGDNGRHTFFAALVSAAYEQDLSAQFIDAYHFPIVQSLFDSAYVAFLKIVGLTCYVDNDGDGFGDADSPVTCFTGDCSCQSNSVSDTTDCDDADSSVSPGAAEVCNGSDDNCNAQSDEGLGDDDADGYGSGCDNCLAFASPGNVAISTGDVNASGSINSADVIYSVNYVFKTGADPLPCAASADVDCNRAINSADIIYTVNYVFKSGAPPCDVCGLAPGGSPLLCP